MRKIYFILIVVTFLLTSCGGLKVENPEVSEDNTYAEKSEDENNMTENVEQTGLTINGEDWIALKGNFKTSDDEDFFMIDVDQSIFPDDTTKYNVSFVAIVNDEDPLNKISRSGFPITVVSYKEGMTDPMNFLGIGLSGGFKLEPGAVKLRVYIHGKKPDDNSESMYMDNNSYTVKLK